MKYIQVNNKDTRRRHSGVFIVKIGHISHPGLLFLLLINFEDVIASWVSYVNSVFQAKNKILDKSFWEL